MKSFLSIALCIATFASTLPAEDSIRGFQTKDLRAQRQLEEKALAIPDPARLRKYMEFMAAQPHHAGSARDKAVAEWALAQLKEWGLDDAMIDEDLAEFREHLPEWQKHLPPMDLILKHVGDTVYNLSPTPDGFRGRWLILKP